MNKYYYYNNQIKQNYYLNISTQDEFTVGSFLNISFHNETKKEHDFKGTIISKNFNEKNKIIILQRFLDNLNFAYLININSPLIKSIQISNTISFKRSKLYYTKFLNEKEMHKLIKY